MASTGERTHYQVLGVAPGAAPDEIRRAHRQLARVLHPDRQSSATTAERALAERRMREVNAAWTTLSDRDRRTRYDRELQSARASANTGGSSQPNGASRSGGSAGPAGPRSAGPSGHADADDPDLARERARLDELDPDEPELGAAHFWLLRRGPIVLIVVVGALLFLVTAYVGGNAATSEDEAPRTTAAPQDCVRLVEGRTAVRTSCETANVGRIMTRVDQPLDCPARTSYVILDDRVVCVTTDPSVTSNLPSGGG